MKEIEKLIELSSPIYENDYFGIITTFKSVVGVAENLDPVTALQLCVVGFVVGMAIGYFILKSIQLR